jgi:hypothetical protein
LFPSFPLSSQRSEGRWTNEQQKILDILQQQENHRLPVKTLCQKAGISMHMCYKAIKDPSFATVLESLSVPVKRQWESHTHVTLASNPEDELAKDVWDMRRLKANYPKHKDPNSFKVDFTWITNPTLRQQVKLYFRQRLPRWEAKTFQVVINHLKQFLSRLPQETHIGTLDRRLVEHLLPEICQLGDYSAYRSLQAVKAMLTFMATSAAWTGPRPPRDLIWSEELPSQPIALPRPIPPPVLDQLDLLLDQAIEVMNQGQSPLVLSPTHWDAILILRHTGMRAEDMAHLKAPDEHGRNGCLDQDSDG